MKKLVISLCLLCVTIAAQAQFEQGKWIINSSVTGLNLSHSKAEGTQFGVGGQIGAFLVDDVALMVSIDGEWTDFYDAYRAGVGGRYYFQSSGIYIGAGLDMTRLKIDGAGSNTNFGISAETGYAFFITKTVTIEPAVYYNLSFDNSNFSKYGLKIGFGVYF